MISNSLPNFIALPFRRLNSNLLSSRSLQTDVDFIKYFILRRPRPRDQIINFVLLVSVLWKGLSLVWVGIYLLGFFCENSKPALDLMKKVV